MAYDFTFSELASDLGTNTADGLRNVANTAANFACDLYQNYSNTAVGLPDPTGIGAFNNALYSRLCAPRGKNPPAPPAPPFTGGQCPKKYDVTVVYNFKNQGNTTVTVPNVLGPVRGVNRGPSTSSGRTAQRLQFAPDATYPTGTRDLVSNTDPNEIVPFEVVSITPVPRSGPDDCGDPVPSYPIKYPPNSSVTNNNTTVNVGAGFIINAPISIIPVTVNAGVLFKPQIQVDVGPFNVTFDMGGVTINPTFNTTNNTTNPSPNYTPPSTKPPVPRNTDNDPCDTTQVTTDLTQVLTKLDNIEDLSEDIKECSCPIGYEVLPVELGTHEGGVFALPKNTFEVNVFMIDSPENAKVQLGRGDHPDQYFWGYYEFGNGVTLTERIPLNTARGCFFPPPWATAFGINCYAGYTARIVALQAIPEKAGAEFAVVQMKKAPV